MDSWQILGIGPTDDLRGIKRAYARQLRLNNPEDDPEGFMRVRGAYEDANEMARSGQWKLCAGQAPDEDAASGGENWAGGDEGGAAWEPVVENRVEPEQETPQEGGARGMLAESGHKLGAGKPFNNKCRNIAAVAALIVVVICHSANVASRKAHPPGPPPTATPAHSQNVMPATPLPSVSNTPATVYALSPRAAKSANGGYWHMSGGILHLIREEHDWDVWNKDGSAIMRLKDSLFDPSAPATETAMAEPPEGGQIEVGGYWYVEDDGLIYIVEVVPSKFKEEYDSVRGYFENGEFSHWVDGDGSYHLEFNTGQGGELGRQ